MTKIFAIVFVLIGLMSTAAAVVPGKCYRVEPGEGVMVSYFCLVPDQGSVRLAAFLAGNMDACLYMKVKLATRGNESVFQTDEGKVVFMKHAAEVLERGKFVSEVFRRNGGNYQQMESTASAELMQTVRKLRTERACRDFDEQD